MSLDYNERNQFIQEIYNLEYRRLFQVAKRLTGNAVVAQDLVQDTFVLAILHYDDLATHSMPEAWLMLTLSNLICNERRARKNYSALFLADTIVMSTKTENSFDELLPTGLSNDDRKLLTWRFKQQLNYKEISNRLGISEVACRKRLSRAVTRCKELLNL